MSILWSILSPLLGPIVKALGMVGLYFKGRSDARTAGDLRQAQADLAVAEKAADVRKRLAAADGAERRKLRFKYTRPD
jgi:hypothetical protein